MAIDIGKLEDFLGRFTADLGATVAAGNVVIGHRLGLYRALAAGPADAGELAARTGTSPRYVAEWLCGQAAGGYVQYPNALSQAGGYTLGAQAGEAAIRQLAADAGFTRFRRATETPFNLIYEARA
jgi:hypothetical protein